MSFKWMKPLAPQDAALVADIRQLIDSARQRAAVAVNAELTLLYWQVGRRIQAEVLKGERAAYGQQIVPALAARLTAACGRGWGEKQLRYCLRAAETFPDEAIVSTLRRQLNWTHIKKMKTKWGSCNPVSRRVWFNLELAKKTARCIEYIVVHELVHLLERLHNERFSALLDTHLPLWRQYREMLSVASLGHEEWSR